MRDVRDALQALLDASDEQYFALDLDGRYLAFNEAHVDEVRTLYGVDIALGDRQTDSSITPTDREAALASHRRVLAGERFVLEAELGEEGGRRCFELTHAPLADTAGATVGLTVRVKDITERRRLERELDEERRRFELLVEHSSEATLLCHPDGAILTANPAACRMFGRTEEELREIGRAGLVDETDPRYPDGLERRRQTGRHEGELRMVRVDGTSFPAEVSTTVFTDPAGNERTSVIIRDLTERAAAEAALRESEAMRDVAEKVSLTGSYRFDLSTQKLTVSPGMYRVYDAAPGEFGGDPTKVMAERLHPEDQGKMRQAWKDFARTGEPALLEHRVVHRDGTIHSLSGGGEVVYDAAGNAVALAGYFRDVSEQRAAEGALRESEELHRSILSASPDDITVADLEGRILVVSPTAAKMFGYQRDEEAIGRSLTDFLVPEQREYANGRLALLFQEPPPGPEEYVGLRADGSTLPLEVHGAPIHDEDGRPARIVLVIRDITDRRRAELELRDSQEQLALAVEGSGAGLWDWHVQTGEAAFNERWAEIVGYSIDELEPLSIATWTDLCHPEDFGRSTKLLEEHFSGRSPRYECEARMRHKDGHWVWVMDRGKVSEWDEEGRPLRMAGTHLDITERKQAEAVITHLNAERRRASSAAPNSVMPWRGSWKRTPTRSPTTCARRCGPSTASARWFWMTTALV